MEIADTKSMCFGESQKLVKKIFTDYQAYKKQEKICPISLFNEADAVIGNRKSAGWSCRGFTFTEDLDVLPFFEIPKDAVTTLK